MKHSSSSKLALTMNRSDNIVNENNSFFYYQIMQSSRKLSQDTALINLFYRMVILLPVPQLNIQPKTQPSIVLEITLNNALCCMAYHNQISSRREYVNFQKKFERDNRLLKFLFKVLCRSNQSCLNTVCTLKIIFYLVRTEM